MNKSTENDQLRYPQLKVCNDEFVYLWQFDIVNGKVSTGTAEEVR